MKITNGTTTYDTANWAEELVKNYLASGWTKAGDEPKSPSKKKDIKTKKVEAVEELVSYKPTNLEENDNGGN
tara:strand:- start:1112 stop:1327 length:216 start_codon:yes stop_codon:yes gene_type:complete